MGVKRKARMKRIKEIDRSDTPFDKCSRIPTRIKKMHVMQVLKQLRTGYRFLAFS